MEDVKAKLANRLKEANNVLVSVTNNPTVDQFAAAIAMTLILNKLGKHATTVFSGTIPSTVEFLQPEKIVEKNTDSLRDFIISLDKSKADKLRYKIEDNFVKIFITPYHSSIGEKDLVFSQGDFNVDVVFGLGVHQREELDQAITAHGRILHDATVITVNTQPPSNLGSINWSDSKSSSLCEMLVVLSDLLAKQGLFDTQISNALLTGIVAETQRFSNQKTTSATMEASSKLLASGANQQLVATQLTPKPAPTPPSRPLQQRSADKPKEEGTNKPADQPSPPPAEPPAPNKSPDGEIRIEHENQSSVTQVQIDDQGTLKKVESATDPNKPEPPKDELPEVNPAPVEPPAPEVPVDNMPDMNFPPPPTYTPPPLIPIPADPKLDNNQPVPPLSQPLPPNPPMQPTIPDAQPSPPQPPVSPDSAAPSNFANSPDPSNSSFLNGPKLVLEPPSMAGQLNANENGIIDDEAVPDPLSNLNMSGAPVGSPTPMLTHNSGPATPQPENPSSGGPQPTVNAPNLPNLDEVRSAVNSALSSTPPDVSNLPLASLNAQPVNLNLNQSPPPFSPPTVLPPNPLSQPNPQVIQPQSSPNAPPVPPPIIPLNDTNLPPSFTAL